MTEKRKENGSCLLYCFTYVASRWLLRPLVLSSRVGRRLVGKWNFPVEQFELFDGSVAVHRPRYVVIVLVPSVFVAIYLHRIWFSYIDTKTHILITQYYFRVDIHFYIKKNIY